MKSTGERFIPNANMGEEIELEHMHRYYASSPLLKGKVVLDAACGVGYGSKILAENAKKVIGIDIDPETVAYAKQNNDAPNIDYRVMSVEHLDFPDNSFDVVVSFETIEHVPEDVQHLFLSEIVRVLKQDGFLIISTPDKDYLLAKSNNKYSNPFHIKEYGKQGFIDLLGRYFSHVSIQYQERVNCSLISAEDIRTIHATDFLKDGSYLIAICSKVPTDLSLGSVYLPSKLADTEVHAFFYPDKGTGYSDAERYSAIYDLGYDGTFQIALDTEDLDPQTRALRFDPCDFPAILSISCTDEQGTAIPIKAQNRTYEESDKDVFMHSDPFYVVSDLGDHTAQKLIFTGVLERIDQADVEAFWSKQTKERNDRLTGEREQLSKLSQQFSDKCTEFQDLSEKFASRNEEFEELSQAFAKKCEEYEVLSADFLSKSRAVDELNTAFLNQKETAETTRSALEDVSNTLLQKQDRIGSLEEENKHQKKEIADYGAIVNQLKAELAETQEAYRQISNATFWRITAPARSLCIQLKAFKWKLLHLKHLMNRAAEVFRTEGIQGVKNKYRIYKTRTQSGEDPAHLNSGLCCFRQIQEEPDIPEEWVAIQPRRPLISVIMAVKDVRSYGSQAQSALGSLSRQKYDNYELILVYPSEEEQDIEAFLSDIPAAMQIQKVSIKNGTKIEDFWDAGIDAAAGEFLCILEQTERLTENAFAYLLDGFNEFPEAQLYLLPDDCYLNDSDYFSPDYKDGAGLKIGGTDALLHVSAFRKTEKRFKDRTIDDWLLSLKKEDIYLVPWIACHREIAANAWEPKAVRQLAFYLPQFHEIPENNAWWGKGFTEWTNVRKAKPLFPGHHQPRIPGELGYYDLGEDGGIEVQKKQIELAKQYGVSGFCYYYYWFDGGKRLLERPLDRHLEDKSLDFPFCLCWANENWTRRWDGLQSEILMPQSYADGWAEQFIRDMLPYLKDDRYIKVNGAPYIMIYNMAEIPNAGEAINTWRRIAADNGIPRLHISAVRRTVNAEELAQSGYTIDSLTDFPPHLLGIVGVDHDDERKFGLKPGQIKDYRKAVAYHSKMPKQNYAYFRTAMLEWDNTARRGENATVFEEYSISGYQQWLYSAKRYTIRQNLPGEDIVFINAWNEWCEGTYLEPSEPNGREALEATLEVSKMR